MSHVLPDTGAAVSFLKAVYPNGPWVLTCIAPDKKAIQTVTFTEGEEAQMGNWIDQFNGVRNLYWTVNEVREPVASKPLKTDITRVHMLHVDIDPATGRDIEEEKQRAIRLVNEGRDGIPVPPTLIIDSGGGIQAFWFLAEPLQLDGSQEAWSELERYNRHLEFTYGGDHCFNVDRIMRLPGSINVPDKKKLEKGRKPALAKVLDFDPTRRWPLTHFKQAAMVRAPADQAKGRSGSQLQTGNIERINDLSELDKWTVPDRVKEIIVQGDARSSEGPKPKDDSRSAWLFDALCSMARCKVPREVMYSILTDPDFGISRSVLELGAGAESYALRQIDRAIEVAIDPRLMELNDRFAVIENVGGRCRVMEEQDSDVTDLDSDFGRRTRLTFQSFEDFRNRFMNQLVESGQDAKGKPNFVPLGQWWLKHPNRRQYRRIVFNPGADAPNAYNLWRGFTVQPKPGDCSLFKTHLLKNICRGDQTQFDYVWGWMARAVQIPNCPGETALVLRGAQGTGKGTVAHIFGSLFGRHYAHVTHARHFVGNFNAHLRDCVVLFADEAFFAGDKQHESALKTLITEPTMQIELKGVDIEQMPNYIHLIMSSNKDWVVPAGPMERRFVILDVASDEQQNEEYFAAIRSQMKAGGLAALLHELLNHDLTGFRFRNVPRTSGLLDQQLLSADPMEDWWLHRLQDGAQVHRSDRWQSVVPFTELVDDFIETAKRFNVARRGSETHIARFLQRHVPNLKKSRPTRKVKEFDPKTGAEYEVTRQVPCYNFPSLDECRAHYATVTGMAMTWPEDTESPTPEPAEKIIPF